MVYGCVIEIGYQGATERHGNTFVTLGPFLIL